ncbi:hypothetical protein Lepto7375DRAFT_5520 [Leptolyngbya sp. PCC 7375]|nr:hypothetical protein Lepto7375DRAFT_5520 [Leptolyngbya sp. PCC 7375]
MNHPTRMPRLSAPVDRAFTNQSVLSLRQESIRAARQWCCTAEKNGQTINLGCNQPPWYHESGLFDSRDYDTVNCYPV